MKHRRDDRMIETGRVMERRRHEHDVFLGKAKFPVECIFTVTHIIVRQQNPLRTSGRTGGTEDHSDILSVFCVHTPFLRKRLAGSEDFPKQWNVALPFSDTVDQHNIF